MFSMHVPTRLSQISRSFARTDGTAWVVVAIGACTAALVYAAFFLN